jgi:uncharacterized protein YkwD
VRPSRVRTQGGALLALALLSLALLPPGLAAPADAAAASSAAREPFRVALLRQLNRVRAHHALPPVRADRRLHGEAIRHSRDMAHRSYFAHGPWTLRVKAASSSARSIGEVIGRMTAADPAGEAAWMVRAWLASPPHRAVLLDRDFRRVGIGRATRTEAAGTDSLYTADFASAR